MCDLVDLDVLRPCHTGGLTSNFAPGVGKLTVFNTWLVLRWLPTVAGQIYIDQCGASPTGKCLDLPQVDS